MASLICERMRSLSKREKEVLSFVVRGMTAKMIANQLIISPRTVEQHVENIKNKTGTYSKNQLMNTFSELLVEQAV